MELWWHRYASPSGFDFHPRTSRISGSEKRRPIPDPCSEIQFVRKEQLATDLSVLLRAVSNHLQR